MPEVSIIIPVYNVEKYIRQALDSVVNQTFKDIEIICVDDCTPDRSFEIVREYAAKDTRIKLLSLSENSGGGTARNRALETASGRYVMFLDPDDYRRYMDELPKELRKYTFRDWRKKLFNKKTFYIG